MGRYYNGDIDGKFWFGVQSSADGDNFGSTGYKPDYLEYYFDEDNLSSIKDGIQKCLTELGVYKKQIDEFFGERNGYNDEMLGKYLLIDDLSKVKKLLEVYARLELGEKILKCVEENGECSFTAEL